jgi:hypothetical protein
MSNQNDTGGRARPAVIAAGGGQTAIVDYHDLRPINMPAATIGGAASGALFGALPAGFWALMQDNHTLPGTRTFTGGAFLTTGIFTACGAIIGGFLSYLNAKTHNDWAAKVMKDMSEKQKSQNSLT